MRRYLKIHTHIQQWYKENGRKELPWRTTNDSYAIYISEIMLQQTQVKTVLERYYFPFLEKFPSLACLANASEQEVLKMWEGMGYYSRARNLHKAAQQTKGRLPCTYDELIALPGIGKNTAHAIMAFAFHKPVPIMEANVKRILCRFFAKENPSEQELWQLSRQLLDKQHPFNYNQAMMDIGALICTVKSPRCSQCPLELECLGKDSPLSYPRKKTKAKIPIRKRHIIIWQDRAERYFLYKRQETFLGGLYGFMQYADKPAGLKKIGNIVQTYSHFQLQATIYQATNPSPLDLPDEGQWFEYDQINQLPLSEVDKKVLSIIC